MDETKETEGPSQEASKETEGTTSEAQTYTKEQVDKAINDALSGAGRDAKSLETWKQTLEQEAETIKATKAEIEQFKQEQETALLEAIKSNPDAVDWHEQKKKLEEQRKAFQKEMDASKKADLEKAAYIKSLEEKAKLLEQKEHDDLIFKIAEAKKVDPQKLHNLSVKFKIEGQENLESLADELAAEKPPITPDPGMTTGRKEDHSRVRFDTGAPSGKEMISKGLNKK